MTELIASAVGAILTSWLVGYGSGVVHLQIKKFRQLM